MKLSINILNYLKSLFYTKDEMDTELSSKAESNHTHNVATTSANGLMSNTDKSKLDGIAEGANKTIVDSVLSNSSSNPLQNRKIAALMTSVNGALAGKAASLHTHDDRYYTEEEIDNKFDALVGFEARVVLELPTTGESGVLYLILDEEGESGNIYKEFIYVNNSYEEIGTTETRLVVDTSLSSTSTNPVENKVIYEALTGKSNTGHTHNDATTSTSGFMSSSDKSKLNGVATNANNYSLPTASSSTLGGVKVGNNLSISNGVLSSTNTTYGTATTSSQGLMSASDKTKLDGIASGATANTVDSSLSSTSTNPVQNKVVNSALSGKAASSHTHDERYYTESEINTKLSSKSDTSHTHNVATTSASGLMSSSDKNKLDNIASGATKITVDSSLSDSSTNPVQNKVVSNAINGGHIQNSDTIMQEDGPWADEMGLYEQYSINNALYDNLISPIMNGEGWFISTADQNKLNGIATNANNYSLPTASSSTLGGVKVGANLSISNGVLSATNTIYSLPTASSSTLGGIKVGSNLSISNGILSATNTTYGVATTSANGLMSSSDKSKLNGIAYGATANTIDSSLSSTSTNAVQNKVVNSALAGKAASSHTHDYIPNKSTGMDYIKSDSEGIVYMYHVGVFRALVWAFNKTIASSGWTSIASTISVGVDLPNGTDRLDIHIVDSYGGTALMRINSNQIRCAYGPGSSREYKGTYVWAAV